MEFCTPYLISRETNDMFVLMSMLMLMLTLTLKLQPHSHHICPDVESGGDGPWKAGHKRHLPQACLLQTQYIQYHIT